MCSTFLWGQAALLLWGSNPGPLLFSSMVGVVKDAFLLLPTYRGIMDLDKKRIAAVFFFNCGHILGEKAARRMNLPFPVTFPIYHRGPGKQVGSRKSREERNIDSTMAATGDIYCVSKKLQEALI